MMEHNTIHTVLKVEHINNDVYVDRLVSNMKGLIEQRSYVVARAFNSYYRVLRANKKLDIYLISTMARNKAAYIAALGRAFIPSLCLLDKCCKVFDSFTHESCLYLTSACEHAILPSHRKVNLGNQNERNFFHLLISSRQ